jgi:hypothetical protein
MADAGYSADKKFIAEAIRSGKLLHSTKEEHPIIQSFKHRINFLLLDDVLTPHKYDGKKYYSHSAWGGMYQLLVKMNQIRMKNWFWDKLM